MRALKMARHGHRAAWTDARMSHTNKTLQFTNEAPLRILSGQKAMRVAVSEPAPPIVAMAISSTTRCANASDLLLWQITQQWPIRKDFHKKSRWNFTYGSQHDLLA